MNRILASAICLVVVIGCTRKPVTVRFATYNASLNREKAGQLVADLRTPNNQQARNVAEVIQRVRPDVLLINEFDWSQDGTAPQLFQDNYLSIGQNGAEPIYYPFRAYMTVNTGIPTGFDLDNDGQVVMEPGTRGYGNDCQGFGQFPGQYGMLLLSKYPFDSIATIRTFHEFLWKDLPAPMLPAMQDGSLWYSEEELDVLRLSSKTHMDVGLKIGRNTVHVLASHPTPPAFDGPEDRNGKRNHDEIRFWALYVTPSTESLNLPQPRPGNFCSTLTDSPDAKGGRSPSFVILGDLNADPADGAAIPGAIQQLLDHPSVNGVFAPSSDGAAESARNQGGKNSSHRGDPRFDTADFSDADAGPGNLRCDYVLPSADLSILDGGVFWPVRADPLHRLVEMQPVATSDHRMVWLDVSVPQK
jgi:3-phytase